MFYGHFNQYVDNYKAMNVILDENTSDGVGQLWLGDYTAAQDKNLIKQKGIKTVLTVASGLSIFYPPSMGITHKTYQILDIESANISRIFNETYQVIADGLKQGNVLVHCAAGVSRSASTVIAYLMKKFGWTFNESFNYVKKKRFVICPNFGFQRQLRAYENTIERSIEPRNSVAQQRERETVSRSSNVSNYQKQSSPKQAQSNIQQLSIKDFGEQISRKFEISRSLTAQKKSEPSSLLTINPVKNNRKQLLTPKEEVKGKDKQQIERINQRSIPSRLQNKNLKPLFKVAARDKFIPKINPIQSYATCYGSPTKLNIVTYNSRSNEQEKIQENLYSQNFLTYRMKNYGLVKK